MIKQSVWSSVISAKLAAKFLNEGGLLALTGAKAALEATPGMLVQLPLYSNNELMFYTFKE